MNNFSNILPLSLHQQLPLQPGVEAKAYAVKLEGGSIRG